LAGGITRCHFKERERHCQGFLRLLLFSQQAKYQFRKQYPGKVSFSVKEQSPYALTRPSTFDILRAIYRLFFIENAGSYQEFSYY